eukprot:GEMP01007262.1.p1 GENE.GEMP01007262.1~~GEMP01007262.1.p1  ORF type:complete len:713 (+),score=110.80 GEMP01007262.1:84-2222(+)
MVSGWFHRNKTPAKSCFQMDQLIEVVNNLHDILTQVGMHLTMDLPQIAVVGGQSAGKSSVLEAIVGKDFLPRGQGIVTRRPLVLQLHCTSRNKARGSVKEYGQFAHTEQTFDSFASVRREIERETERLGGKNKGISAQPIQLKIFSPNVIDLTLIDLPGLTRIPVGDQPPDVEKRIRELILQYVSKPNCIILAVTAANTDLATSDALNLAREVDPQGVRTIGVLTKMDLVEEGTNVLDILDGRFYPLRQGYVGVVCRSQRNLDKTIQQGLQIEETFFRSHSVYRNAQNRVSIPVLAKLLNRSLMYHIRDALPDLKVRLSRAIHEHETELMGYGDPLIDQKTNQGALVLHLFTKFARYFHDAIEGKIDVTQDCDHLTGGARIHHIFHDIFAKSVMEFDALNGLSDREIRTAIRNCTGPRTSLFVPEVAFEILVKKQIVKLEEPGLQCIEAVFEELQRLVLQCELPDLGRFVNLREKIFEVVRGVLRKLLPPTQQMVGNLIQIELAYINTNHPDFIGGSRAFCTMQGGGYGDNTSNYPPAPPQPQPLQRQDSRAKSKIIEEHPQVPPENGFFSFFKTGSTLQKPLVSLDQMTKDDNHAVIRLPQVAQTVTPTNAPSDRERVEIDIIKSLISSYFNVVRKNVVDAVPKSIMYFMVNTAKDVIQRECVSQLYKPEFFDVLLKEADDIRERREKCKESLLVLRSAVEAISQIRDYQV